MTDTTKSWMQGKSYGAAKADWDRESRELAEAFKAIQERAQKVAARMASKLVEVK